MNYVTKRINIDLYSSDFSEIVRTQQGDNLTRFVEIALFNQNEPYTISSDVVVKVEGHRGDNSLFSKSCSCSNNIITLELDDDILLYAGMVKAKVILYSSDYKKILSSAPFRISVEEAPCDTNKEVETKGNLYNDLYADVQKINGILTGKMHICGIRTVTLTADTSISADSTVELSKSFSAISRATSYMIIPYNMSYCTPQSTKVASNVLTATLHNVTNSSKVLSASFYVLGYA